MHDARAGPVAALAFAREAHRGHRRDGSGLPYIVHLVKVARLLRVEGLATDYTLSLAYLHDTVEDTKVTVDDLRARFGPRVAEGVMHLTKHPNLAGDAGAEYQLRQARAMPRAPALVKIADVYANSLDMQKGAPAQWKPHRLPKFKAKGFKLLKALEWASPEFAAKARAAVQNLPA